MSILAFLERLFPVGKDRQTFYSDLLEIPQRVLDVLCTSNSANKIKTDVGVKFLAVFSNINRDYIPNTHQLKCMYYLAVPSKEYIDFLNNVNDVTLRVFKYFTDFNYTKYEIEALYQFALTLTPKQKEQMNVLEKHNCGWNLNVFTRSEFVDDLENIQIEYLSSRQVILDHSRFMSVLNKEKMDGTEIRAWMQLYECYEWVLSNSTLCTCLSSFSDRDRVWFWKHKLNPKLINVYRTFLPTLRLLLSFGNPYQAGYVDSIGILLQSNPPKDFVNALLFVDPKFPLTKLIECSDQRNIAHYFLSRGDDEFLKYVKVLATRPEKSLNIPYSCFDRLYKLNELGLELDLISPRCSLPDFAIIVEDVFTRALRAKDEKILERLVTLVKDPSVFYFKLLSKIDSDEKPGAELIKKFIQLMSRVENISIPVIFEHIKETNRDIIWDVGKYFKSFICGCTDYFCKKEHYVSRKLCEESCLNVECGGVHPSTRLRVCIHPENCYLYKCGDLHAESRPKPCPAERQRGCSDWNCEFLHCRIDHDCRDYYCEYRHPVERPGRCKNRICRDDQCIYLHKSSEPPMCKWGGDCRKRFCRLRHY